MLASTKSITRPLFSNISYQRKKKNGGTTKRLINLRLVDLIKIYSEWTITNASMHELLLSMHLNIIDFMMTNELHDT
jgi:hypothetical protein